MTYFEGLRNVFFRLKDFAGGGKVQRHLSDVTGIMTQANPERVSALNHERLLHILQHAQATTEYYKRFKVQDGLEAFPVIDKNIIRRNLPNFLSTRFRVHQRIPAITSGSTGTPFKTYQDPNKKLRNAADTMYFASLGGYTVGNKLYYFKIWSDYNRKSWLLQKIQNIVPVDVLNLEAQVYKVIAELNKNVSPVSFIGYVSAFETLCRALDKSNTLSDALKVNSIITMSESLNDYTRVSGEKYFSCPVLSRYSNIENGIIAQQTLADRNAFLINKASYYVEVLHMDKDEPVTNGTPGRIIVTDYFNMAMPLIRYDTGDLGVMEDRVINGIAQQVFSKIEGRKLDQIYNTRGELVSSYIVYRNMWKYTELDQYQFVQKGAKSYEFRVCTSGVFTREAELRKEFVEYLGADADFTILYVNDIPLLKSGKRKKVVNEMSA